MNYEKHLAQKAKQGEELMKQRKIDQFQGWLMGEDVQFPFFKSLPEVKLPKKFN